MLIDAFTFFNEKELVELRIRYLEEIVDFFVIVEANITHQGKKKEWNFPNILKKNLEKFSHKIQYHQLNINLDDIKNEESWIRENVKGDQAWRIENFQRNFIKTACKKFSDGDILIISDVDELPNKKKLKFILSCDFNEIAPVALQQYQFQLDCNYVNDEIWRGSVVTTMKNNNNHSPQIIRNARYNTSCLFDAGWSFSSFGGTENVIEKIEAFAHKEYNIDKFKDSKHIIHCQKNGLDLFNRKIKTIKVSKNFFPKDLLEIMEEKNTFYFGNNAV